MIRRLVRLFRRVRSDYQVTYLGGDSVRRIERGRTVEWYVNGAPAPEAEAVGFTRAKEGNRKARF